MEVVRLRCEHLPDVPILGIGTGASRFYLAHAQNLVSLLKGKLERTAACRAFNTFLQSTAGRVINEQDGGELLSASLPLDKMMYSYRVQKCGRGSASRFVTLEGAKEIVQKLPGVSDEMKAKLSPFLEADAMSFEEVTPEQCEKEDAQEAIEEICTGGSGGGFNGDAAMSEQTIMVSWKVLNQYRVSLIESEADRKYLRSQLDMEKERKLLCQANKDIESKLAVAVVQVQNANGLVVFEKERADRMEAAAKEQMEREKDHADKIEAMAKEKVAMAEAVAKEQVEREKEKAAMAEAAAKERFEREKLQQETVFLQEKAALELKVKEMEAKAKDMELANLRMQLEREKTRNSAMGEGGRSSSSNSGRKRAQESALDTEDEGGEEESDSPPLNSSVGAKAVKAKLPANSCGAQLYWLVVYEGDVEVLFHDLQPELPVLSNLESARFNDRWFALLSVSRRIRSKPIMRAVYKMGLAGRVWVEAGHDCKKWVDIDIPACDANLPASVCITAYMGKKQSAPARFAMVVVK